LGGLKLTKLHVVSVIVFGIIFLTANKIWNIKPVYIAHAGGGIQNQTYTNSLESLKLSYESGFELIELDFEWTTDDQLVLIHDWDQTFENLFKGPKGAVSLEKFLSLEMKLGLTQLSLKDLVLWLDEHPGIRIVTDVKRDNLKALRLMKETDPKFASHFLPQIYDLPEFEEARNLGFSDIILTLYRAPLSDEQVIEFSKSHALYAVTMPIERALKSELPLNLQKLAVWTYSHTINDIELKSELQAKGIQGIYTDFLMPSASGKLLARLRSR